jgi:7,8-dihydro-6-hydroxymethylpterin-pyrophosphokinase
VTARNRDRYPRVTPINRGKEMFTKLKKLIKKYEKLEDREEELRWDDEQLDLDVCVELKTTLVKLDKVRDKIKVEMRKLMVK